jgi:hypothetical protein
VPAEIKVDNPLGEYRGRCVYLMRKHQEIRSGWDDTVMNIVTMPESTIWLLTDESLEGEPGEYFITPRSYSWTHDNGYDLADMGYKSQGNALRKVKKLKDFLDYTLPPDYSKPVPLF